MLLRSSEPMVMFVMTVDSLLKSVRHAERESKSVWRAVVAMTLAIFWSKPPRTSVVTASSRLSVRKAVIRLVMVVMSAGIVDLFLRKGIWSGH